jgi:hypothetical protein
MIFELCSESYKLDKENYHSIEAQDIRQKAYALNHIGYKQFGVDYASVWRDREFKKPLNPETVEKKTIEYEVDIDD